MNELRHQFREVIAFVDRPPRPATLRGRYEMLRELWREFRLPATTWWVFRDELRRRLVKARRQTTLLQESDE